MKNDPKVQVTIDISEKYFLALIRDNEFNVVDESKLKGFIHSPKFAKLLADDILEVWKQANMLDSCEFVEAMFLEFIEDPVQVK